MVRVGTSCYISQLGVYTVLFFHLFLDGDVAECSAV